MLMLKSRELREQRAKLIVDVRKALDGELTPEVRAKVEAIDKDIDKLSRDIELYEKQETRERELAAQGTVISEPGAEGDDEKRKKAEIEKEGAEYRNAFIAYLREGEAALSPEQRATLRKGFRNVDKPELRAQTITTTGGGYLIPQGFMAELERALKFYGGVRKASRVIPTSGGNPLPWPTIDDTGNTGEASAINTNISGQDMTFGSVMLNAYKMDSGLILVPNELFEDSGIPLDSEISSMLGERLGRRQNNQFTLGSGTSTYQGCVVASSNAVTGASQTAIAPDELFDLFHSVDPAYRQDPSCSFMAHDLTIKAWRKFKDADGNYIWQPGLAAGQPDRLLGMPVVVNQDMATIAAAATTVLFGVFRKFIVREVRGIVVRRLNELYAQADQVGFLAFWRGDSRLVSAAPSRSFVNYTQHA